MKKILIILFTIISFQIVSAQAIVRNIRNFTVLRVFDKIPVTLISSTENKVEIDGLKKEDVKTVRKGGELIIMMDKLKLLNDDEVNVKVYYKKLKSIHACEGSTITGNNKLEVNLLNIGATEGSKITVLVGVNRIHAKLNSKGEIKVSGMATHQNIKVSSGGKYDAKELDSNKVAVAVISQGTAIVNSNGLVETKIKDGGDINVYGGAEVIKKGIEGGGYVNIY
ncbi:head GIN domain-containing protein [Apibacter mensalis]|nr:head GIN domain-containing protein [Apibacter mensalis]